MLDDVQKYAVMGMLSDNKNKRQIAETLKLSPKSQELTDFLKSPELKTSSVQLKIKQHAVKLLTGLGVDLFAAYKLVNDNFTTKDEYDAVEKEGTDLYDLIMSKQSNTKNMFVDKSNAGNDGAIAMTTASAISRPSNVEPVVHPTSKDIFVINKNAAKV